MSKKCKTTEDATPQATNPSIVEAQPGDTRGGEQDPSRGVPLTSDTVDLFRNIYKNIEKEFITFTDYVYIDDRQKGVYSLRIAELILRTAAEIESLCKDLYATLGCDGGGGRFYYDDPCIKEFISRWDIDKKIVEITHPFVRFSTRELIPFRDADKKTQGNPNANVWKKSYNDIKHNFRNNMGSANIGAFLEELAALYLLNIYAGMLVKCDSGFDRDAASRLDCSFGSSLFAVKVSKILYAKSIGADGVLISDGEYRPEVLCYAMPTEKSLRDIYNIMKAAEAEAWTSDVLTEALRDLCQNGELKLPVEGGPLDAAAREKIMFKARFKALNKCVNQFGKAVERMKYEMRLNSKELYREMTTKIQ